MIFFLIMPEDFFGKNTKNYAMKKSLNDTFSALQEFVKLPTSLPSPKDLMFGS